MAEMHSGIKGWSARASCTVYRNLPRPHLDQGISGRILDTLHTLGFMQICFLRSQFICSTCPGGHCIERSRPSTSPEGLAGSNPKPDN